MIVEVEEGWFSDLSYSYRTVLEKLGDEILLFKGRMERVEFPQVGLGMCLCLGSRWWCLVVGEGSPSVTVCSAGKETLVETTHDHASLPCVGVTAYLVGSVMISSLFLILFYVFNNDVFAVSV